MRDLPPWAWDPVLLGPAHELARRWLGGLPVSMEEAVPVVSDAVWHAIRG